MLTLALILLLSSPALACSGEGAGEFTHRLTVIGLGLWGLGVVVATRAGVWAYRERERALPSALLIALALGNPCFCFNPKAGDCGLSAVSVAMFWLVVMGVACAVFVRVNRRALRRGE